MTNPIRSHMYQCVIELVRSNFINFHYKLLGINVSFLRIRKGEQVRIELEHLHGFLVSVEKKLSNERFVNSAPVAVVEIEKKKQTDALAKIKAIEESLKAL